MKKLAIFVEGLTEQLFVERLLQEVADVKRIRIEKRQATGGRLFPRKLVIINSVAPDPAHEFYVLIVDSQGGSSVISDIRDSYDGLVREGYERIIGLRDVYPETQADIPLIERAMRYRLKTVPLNPATLLAVMEIEAWFIAEHTHFERIDPRLTPDVVRAAIGFDPATENVEARPHPAGDLHEAYQAGGKAYRKERGHLQRTVNVLDYCAVYMNLPARVPRLGVLVREIDAFLS